MKNQLTKLIAFIALIVLLSLTHTASAAPRATGGTFTVNTTLDAIQSDSTLSLREAILLSNGGTGPNGLNHGLTDGEKAQTNGCTFSNNAAPWQISGGCGRALTDTIHFNIPGAGVHTIKWLAATPGANEPVIIDAYSQPGSHANTLKHGDNAVRLITLDASNSYGFYLAAGYSTVRGFEITTYSSGIYVEKVGDDLIEGNYIHDADLFSTGIHLHWGDFNKIGGSAPAARNILSNADYGIRIEQWSTFNIVQGNLIGTDLSGKHAFGNAIAGIELSNTAFNLIGGESPAESNVIAFNYGKGVLVEYASSSNNIRHNSIFSNYGMGIDLGQDGTVTPNDDNTTPPDADTGANELQNFPELSAAISFTSTLKGKLFTAPNAAMTLEFFKNANCAPASMPAGKTFLAKKNIKSNAKGVIKFTIQLKKKFKPGSGITATATDPSGNTSEFSACKTAS